MKLKAIVLTSLIGVASYGQTSTQDVDYVSLSIETPSIFLEPDTSLVSRIDYSYLFQKKEKKKQVLWYQDVKNVADSIEQFYERLQNKFTYENGNFRLQAYEKGISLRLKLHQRKFDSKKRLF